MADPGWVGLGGAAGAGDAIADIQNQRLKAISLAQTDALTRIKAQEQSEAIQSRLELTRQAQADRTDAIKARNQDRADRTAMLQATLRPIGSEVTPQEMQQETSAGVPSALYNQQPAQPAMPSDFQGPMPEGQTTAAQPAKIIFRGSQAEADKQAALQRQQAADAQKADYERQLVDIRQQLADRPAKEPTPHFTFQPIYNDQGQPAGVGQGNTLTGEFKPVAGSPNIRPPAGSAQLAKEAHDKEMARGMLDQLDQAIEAAKDYVGPGEGRVSNVEQMVGNAHKEVQALGAKMLMTKMKVDAALGGMRAAASPQLLARWDNLLANKVTPENLHESVRAMREMIGPMETGTRKRIVYDVNGKPIQ